MPAQENPEGNENRSSPIHDTDSVDVAADNDDDDESLIEE